MGTITTSDGTEIFYKDWGRGTPIVFSHGWRSTWGIRPEGERWLAISAATARAALAKWR
jgi:pimeloyl-ACP methyl ester carboxylesterase